jgi:hypothetical protein
MHLTRDTHRKNNGWRWECRRAYCPAVSETAHVPELRSLVQRIKDILYAGTGVAILQPASFNGPPQSVAESQAFRPLRFLWSNPLQDLIDDHNIRINLDVGMVSAQDLGYHRLAVRKNEFTHANTYFVDDHPESVTVGLPCWSIALYPKHFWV